MSRRSFATLALGASAAAVAGAQRAEAASKPEFITDDSGIKYFDVKQGSGAGPVEGDFVVVDYVRFVAAPPILNLLFALN